MRNVRSVGIYVRVGKNKVGIQTKKYYNKRYDGNSTYFSFDNMPNWHRAMLSSLLFQCFLVWILIHHACLKICLVFGSVIVLLG